VETSSDSLIWEKDARYEYYKHGPLARMAIGDQFVQGVDYAYTLQGWLKGVNSTVLRSTHDMGEDGKDGSVNQYTAKDAIGFNLNYFTGDYSAINAGVNPFPGHTGYFSSGSYNRPLFNGNISSMAVNIKALNSPRLYTYSYDQLNRLTGMDSWTGLDTTNNNWSGLVGSNEYRERIKYDANGNILKYNRYTDQVWGGAMDSLTYIYYGGTNRLRQVRDSGTNYYSFNPPDIHDQTSTNNYTYDEIGNLITDDAEYITSVSWNVYGKIREINRTASTYNPVTKIQYTYDAAGNRIGKTVWKSGTPAIDYTWYVRDAQGNILKTYHATGSTSDTSLAQSQLNVQEQIIYGSSRLGLTNVSFSAEGTFFERNNYSTLRGFKQYELTNHLGNVLATVSDLKKPVASVSDPNLIAYYDAMVTSANDYYPFGMIMPARQVVGNGYRFGFNGKENDNEVKGVEGTQQDYGMRIYDPRLGRFLSVDPLTQSYPWYTPYQFAGNKPISFLDRDGLEEGLDNITRRREEAFLNGKISENEYRAQTRASGIAGVIGGAIVLDVYVLKGRATQFLLFSQFAGAFEHNRAKTEQGRIEQDNRSKKALTEVFLGWGVARIVGSTITFFNSVAREEIKYLFRGTSEGFEGSAALQKLSITPTSSDPVVATVFAVSSKNYGKGVLQIALPKELQGVEFTGNVLQSLEKEVAVGLKPADFASKTSLTITADQASGILNKMGVKLPQNIPLENISKVLKETPRLNQSQIDEFFRQAVKIKTP
jgi:RHS repeat-associated protein